MRFWFPRPFFSYKVTVIGIFFCLFCVYLFRINWPKRRILTWWWSNKVVLAAQRRTNGNQTALMFVPQTRVTGEWWQESKDNGKISHFASYILRGKKNSRMCFAAAQYFSILWVTTTAWSAIGSNGSVSPFSLLLVPGNEISGVKEGVMTK